MRKTVFVVSIFSILFFVQLAYAQLEKGSGPKFYSDFKPVIGGWAEYQMTQMGGPPAKMKIAIVGKEGMPTGMRRSSKQSRKEEPFPKCLFLEILKTQRI